MKKRVVALGFFDGVHIGHGALLEMTVRRAAEKDASAAVMTYSNHPSSVVAPSAVKLINTTEERCALIRELYGISDIIVKEFTKEYSSLSGEAFVTEIIKKELAAYHVVAGFDFRFGRGGKCDAQDLVRICADNGIGCDVVDAVELSGEPVSSSRIRECVAAGDMGAAHELLGHYHCIMSEVSHGAHLGKTLGFPTANQEIQDEVLCAKHGVYLSRVTVDGKIYKGVTNIGVRPTVSAGVRPRAETFIIDFSGDLYGREIKLELVKFMRGEEKFSSVEALRERIERDVAAVKTDF